MTAERIEAPAGAEATLLAKPKRRVFRRSYQAERPSAAVMARQGRLARSAWAALGDRDAVMAFLNTHDEAMGGRPIDLALVSDEGLDRVELAMAAMHRPAI
ncbi:antitoxin Xre/MbcA/ParS toxin-binding domain-containing protein [Sphingomonas lenta]|uniref:Uncharacterized protein n=1 Tax=Sphingomonas lenta TaxID=1141887 RepID=A0A2A2SJA1_9SPHN|nr:antitoxin Xre/MbcA/ParS toxin-binding domain-containing protein [Sphingomonas lenta]PAX09101.1 hypothetical protein CKY28_07200 [Sphingomonas lenta]